MVARPLTSLGPRDCKLRRMPYSAGITDPIGQVLSYVPVALALIAMLIAVIPSAILLLLELAARPRRRGAALPAGSEPATT